MVKRCSALSTRIYGPEAERYFDEAFGTNLHDTNSTYSTGIRHPHEFQRMSSQISRSVGFNRIPWDPLKHPRGRDGRFIEKYGIDAFTATQSQINATLDPNANPSRGRVSDDVRPLLEHFNILDDSQLHNLASDYKVRPDQTSKSPFTDAIHHQIYGEEPKEQDLPYSPNKKPQYRNAVLLPSDGPPATVKFVSTNGKHGAGSGDRNDQEETQPTLDTQTNEPSITAKPTASSNQSEASPNNPTTSSQLPSSTSSSKSSSEVDFNNVLGVEDVPADFEPNRKWKSPGERLSAYIRSQHKAAFDLADQILDTRNKLDANLQEITETKEALRNATKGSRNEQELQTKLKQLTLQQDILQRQNEMFTKRLNTEFADLELPGFSVEIGFKRHWTIPGGVGGQAVLDRVKRDAAGYSADPSLYPDEAEVYRHVPYGEEPEVNGVPTLGFGDLPEHAQKNLNRNNSEGRTLSNHTRTQHAAAFQLADQIIESAKVIAKADEEIAQLQTSLEQANSESAKQEARKRLDWARSSNEIRKRDTQKLVDELHQKHGNVVIPSFRYEGVDGKRRVAGGIRAEAILNRALRDRDGYGVTHLHNDNAGLTPDEGFYFDLASGMSRGVGQAGRSLIKELVDNGKELTTRPVPQSDEPATDSDISSSLPIPKPSASTSDAADEISSTDTVRSGSSNEDTRIPPPPLSPNHELVTPTDLYTFSGDENGPKQPRLAEDLNVQNIDDLVQPQVPPAKFGKSLFGDPEQSGLSGSNFSIPKGTTLPEGLAVEADGVDVNPKSDHPPTHHTMYATREMTAAEFREKFSSLPWKREKTIKKKKKND